MKKPRNFPPEIPGKSPTFSENFRKFPEIPENPGSPSRKLYHFGEVYTRLQPETGEKPPNFPPKIPGKSEELSKTPKTPKIPEVSETQTILPSLYTFTLYHKSP